MKVKYANRVYEVLYTKEVAGKIMTSKNIAAGKMPFGHKEGDREECVLSNNVVSDSNKQVGGTHYEKCGIQPIEYIHANHLNFDEGSVVKYVSRHRNKNGAEDIMKMIQYGTFILKDEYHYTDEQIKEALSKLY